MQVDKDAGLAADTGHTADNALELAIGNHHTLVSLDAEISRGDGTDGLAAANGETDEVDHLAVGNGDNVVPASVILTGTVVHEMKLQRGFVLTGTVGFKGCGYQ